MRSHGFLPVIVVFVAGCSSPADTKDSSPERSLASLPYSVFVDRVRVVDADAGRDKVVEVSRPRRATAELESRLTSAIAAGLRRSGAFERVRSSEDPRPRPQRESAPRRDPPRDLVVRAKATLASGDLPSDTIDAGAALGSSLVWFVSMFPAWFIPDRTYQSVLRLSIETEPRRQDGRPSLAIDTGATDLTFLDRADFAQCLYQIIIPPALVPANVEATRESLLEEAARKTEEAVAAEFSARFALSQVAHGEPFLLPFAAGDGGEKGSIVCLPGEMTQLTLNGLLPPGVSDPGDFPAYAGAAKRSGVPRRECLERMRAYLVALSPGLEAPSLDELDRAYPCVYLLGDVACGARSQTLKISYQEASVPAPVTVSWTVPAWNEKASPSSAPRRRDAVR